MTPEQIEQLGPAFAAYLRQFLFCCDYTQTFHLLEVYCKGLLSDLPRKSAEPIALASGTAVRTLQEFLKDHAWSHAAVRDALQQHVAAALGQLPADDLGTVGVVDETATVKKGAKTPGVPRLARAPQARHTVLRYIDPIYRIVAEERSSCWSWRCSAC